MEPLFKLLGVPIFQGTSGLDLAVLVIVYAFAFMVKGVFGIGAMPVIVLIGALVLDPHQAVLLAMLVVTYSHFLFIPEAFRRGDWRLCGILAIGYVPAIVLGVMIFESLTPTWLGVVVGLVLIGVIVTDAAISPQKIRRLAASMPQSGSIGLAALSGCISGLVGAGGMIFISLYIKSLYDDARRFRATIILIAILLSFWRFTVQYIKGIITVPLLYESLFLLPAAFVGTYLGMRLFDHTPSDKYFRAFRIFLILAALSIVFRSIAAEI